MPELPEVEVVRAGLEPAVTGATVASVTVFDDRSLRRHPGPAEDFVEQLTGATLLAPARRGKYMWIPIAATPNSHSLPELVEGRTAEPPFDKLRERYSRSALVVHLGMSGQVLLREPSVDDRLTRIRIDLEHPSHGRLRLNF